jgi:hypothetical protein
VKVKMPRLDGAIKIHAGPRARTHGPSATITTLTQKDVAVQQLQSLLPLACCVHGAPYLVPRDLCLTTIVYTEC